MVATSKFDKTDWN